MKYPHLNAFGRLLAVMSVLPLTSCTTVTKPKPVSAGYVSTEKIHLKVALNLTDDLRKANWEQRGLLGGADIMAVGPAAVEEASSFARHTFMEVTEVNNGGPPPNPVDAILTPKLPFIGRKNGQTMFSQDMVTVKLEWTLVDPSGNAVWADTVTGEGRAASGWASVLKLALEAGFRKSQNVMTSSRAIQEFVSKKYPDIKVTATAKIIANPEVRELCASLDSADRDKVMDALKKLRRMDAPEAVPEILPCLLSGDSNIVRDACRTLAVLGSKETIINIEPLLKNKRSDIRKDAQDAIDKLRSKP